VALRVLREAQRPPRGADFAAGGDLRAVSAGPLPPGEWSLVPTGLAVAWPAGYEMQIRPRSGLALRHGVTVLNSPGTIDADYRGELKVLLINHGREPFEVTPGMRIAQAVVAQHGVLQWQERDSLPESVRGAGGFGHTGEF